MLPTTMQWRLPVVHVEKTTTVLSLPSVGLVLHDSNMLTDVAITEWLSLSSYTACLTHPHHNS